MNLHEDPKLFNEAIRATSQLRGIQEIYVEKDYWVTYALKTIFSSDCGAYAVFKGGTALSKCYQIIERFSEDIDLVVLRDEGDSGNALARKIKSITSTISEIFPEVAKEGLTSKTGRLRKTAHEYPKVFKGDFGQVRDFIVLEASMLGNFEPYRSMEISSFIYEMMISRGPDTIVEDYDMLPFVIKVLDIKRTFCEKIMSLVRFSYDTDAFVSLANKIRHTYDLYKLLQLPEIDKFFISDAFIELLNTVGHDDVDSFRNNNAWLVHHPKEAIIFKDTDKVWLNLKSTYTGSFSNLVYGELPEPELIVKNLKRIAYKLHEIDWKINIDS